MLTPILASRLAYEWDEISTALAKAVRLDPKRDMIRVLGQGLEGSLQFWRGDGYIVTQMERQAGTLRKTFWIIYASGKGGSIASKRELMSELEQKARKAKCSEIRFEGRDWRRVFPDFNAHRTDDGRWHFRKGL